MAKKKAVKKKPTRPKTYDKKLAIVGTLDDVLKVSIAQASKKQPDKKS